MQHIFHFPCYYLQDMYDMGVGSNAEINVTVEGDAPDNLCVTKVTILHDNMQPLEMSETQFVVLFYGGHDIINNALEDAAKNGTYDVES